jgi:predicted nicotinamide N-methyase
MVGVTGKTEDKFSNNPLKRLPMSQAVAERFDGLYQLLSRKYSLQRDDLTIAGQQFSLFSVKNTDELLDQLAAKDPGDPELVDERLPYWAEIWPSALALSQFLLENPQEPGTGEALEIGCGLGLVSMAAAVAGIRVLLTDYQPDALRMSEMNWLMNMGTSPDMALMDWRKPDLNMRFNLILASDVTYEKRFFWPLVDLFQQLLRPQGRVILSEPNRTIARDFFDLLDRDNFKYERKTVQIRRKEKPVDVGIYLIHKK